MAKGFEKNKERKQKLSIFGKNLTKRSGSKCELCESSNKKLIIYELSPIPEEPEFERCVFICEDCLEQVKNPDDYNYLRCLTNSVWSEIPVVSALSIIILRKIKDKCDFANELLEQVFVDEEVERFL